MTSLVRPPILVTGGAGFVGRHLIALLARERASEIWVVDDLSAGVHPAAWRTPLLALSSRQPIAGGLHFDVLDTESRLVFVNADFTSVALSELERQPTITGHRLPRFEEVYHLASVVGGRAMIDGDPLAVAIDLAIDSSLFLWASKVNRPERLLYASSSAAYPVARQTDDEAVALREDMVDLVNGAFQPDATYGWSKLTGEYLAGLAARKYGLSVAVVRPFSGYGESQDLTYPVPAIALRVAAQQKPVHVWGSGHQGRDFVHIDDCVEACVRACRRISDGSAVNIGSGELVSFREVARLLIELEGYDADVQGLDDRPVGVARRYADIDRMRTVLDWQPSISLRDGLARVLAGARARLEEGAVPGV
ncbi:MAG: NAD-dependent epimerase/dehydratase family protein [Solirubrobacteraceae bacterium]